MNARTHAQVPDTMTDTERLVRYGRRCSFLTLTIFDITEMIGRYSYDLQLTIKMTDFVEESNGDYEDAVAWYEDARKRYLGLVELMYRRRYLEADYDLLVDRYQEILLRGYDGTADQFFNRDAYGILAHDTDLLIFGIATSVCRHAGDMSMIEKMGGLFERSSKVGEGGLFDRYEDAKRRYASLVELLHETGEYEMNLATREYEGRGLLYVGPKWGHLG